VNNECTGLKVSKMVKGRDLAVDIYFFIFFPKLTIWWWIRICLQTQIQICLQTRIQICLRNRIKYVHRTGSKFFYGTGSDLPVQLLCLVHRQVCRVQRVMLLELDLNIFNCGFSTIYKSNSRIIIMWIKHF